MDDFSKASRCFWLILGGYDVQFEGFGGDYVFWAGSAQSEGRRHMHPDIKSPPDGIITSHVCSKQVQKESSPEGEEEEASA